MKSGVSLCCEDDTVSRRYVGFVWKWTDAIRMCRQPSSTLHYTTRPSWLSGALSRKIKTYIVQTQYNFKYINFDNLSQSGWERALFILRRALVVISHPCTAALHAALKYANKCCKIIEHDPPFIVCPFQCISLINCIKKQTLQLGCCSFIHFMLLVSK